MNLHNEQISLRKKCTQEAIFIISSGREHFLTKGDTLPNPHLEKLQTGIGIFCSILAVQTSYLNRPGTLLSYYYSNNAYVSRV